MDMNLGTPCIPRVCEYPNPEMCLQRNDVFWTTSSPETSDNNALNFSDASSSRVRFDFGQTQDCDALRAKTQDERLRAPSPDVWMYALANFPAKPRGNEAALSLNDHGSITDRDISPATSAILELWAED
ncbi:hypothetical protein EAG_12862 [Camponotus floridanus]|uniref:Uncharacterized protein n=1 Tax=Camponotus floridanus TaxID=104421 RepID=E2AKQ9_CAMFO|nr:hypothetical protein EAG_12862 [Camponotus floridanus]